MSEKLNYIVNHVFPVSSNFLHSPRGPMLAPASSSPPRRRIQTPQRQNYITGAALDDNKARIDGYLANCINRNNVRDRARQRTAAM